MGLESQGIVLPLSGRFPPLSFHKGNSIMNTVQTNTPQETVRRETNLRDKWEGVLAGNDPEGEWDVWYKKRDDGRAEFLAQYAEVEDSKYWAHLLVDLGWNNPGWVNTWTKPVDAPAMLAEGGWEKWDWQDCDNLVRWVSGNDLNQWEFDTLRPGSVVVNSFNAVWGTVLEKYTDRVVIGWEGVGYEGMGSERDSFLVESHSWHPEEERRGLTGRMIRVPSRILCQECLDKTTDPRRQPDERIPVKDARCQHCGRTGDALEVLYERNLRHHLHQG